VFDTKGSQREHAYSLDLRALSSKAVATKWCNHTTNDPISSDKLLGIWSMVALVPDMANKPFGGDQRDGE